MAVVEVLISGKTKDATLGACGSNIWLLAALFNISIHIQHISVKSNVIADLLSRFKFDQNSLTLYLLPIFSIILQVLGPCS